MPFAYDPLNPKFTFFSPAQDAKIDLAEHVDHAIIALDGRAPIAGDFCVEQLNEVTGPATLRVDLWVEELGPFNVTYGFLVSSENGAIAYARGERSIVNIDPRSRKPLAWTPAFRASHIDLIKDLPAYA